MSSLAVAFALLTRLPVGSHARPDGRAAGWFGVVGIVLGATVAVPLWLSGAAASARVTPLLCGVLVVAWWAWATRMLHWDGLADTADGVWGGSEPERRLEIMADSSVGAFGVTVIVLTALAQVAAISAVVDAGRIWPFVLAPALGRVAATILVWGRPPARPGGLGAAIGGKPALSAVLATAAAVAAASAVVVALEPRVAPLAVFGGLALAIALPFLLSRPLGGYTGDVLGATILLVETGVLLLGAVA